jgi:hypothetical protein
MKLTKLRLQEIIQEELEKTLTEEELEEGIGKWLKGAALGAGIAASGGAAAEASGLEPKGADITQVSKSPEMKTVGRALAKTAREVGANVFTLHHKRLIQGKMKDGTIRDIESLKQETKDMPWFKTLLKNL